VVEESLRWRPPPPVRESLQVIAREADPERALAPADIDRLRDPAPGMVRHCLEESASPAALHARAALRPRRRV